MRNLPISSYNFAIKLLVPCLCLHYFTVDVEGSKKCQDGKTNIISIQDATEGNINVHRAAPIRFHDVRLLTYDADKKPFCYEEAGALHLPGFIQILSGEVEIGVPMSAKKEMIGLELTLEHNSFFIGSVCEDGKSVNSFVPDDVCSYDFCELLAGKCEFLNMKGRLELAKMLPQWIPIGPAALSQLEGEWRGSAALRSRSGKKLAYVELNGWQYVKVGDEKSERIFNTHPEAKMIKGIRKTDEL